MPSTRWTSSSSRTSPLGPGLALTALVTGAALWGTCSPRSREAPGEGGRPTLASALPKERGAPAPEDARRERREAAEGEFASSATAGPGELPTQTATVVWTRFLDERGNPLAGVELRQQGSQSATTSAPDGSARLVLAEATLAAPFLVLEARHPACARDERRLRSSAGADGQLLLGDWRLVAGGAVEGRVVDEQGLGRAGVRLACAREDVGDPELALDGRLGLELVARPGARATSAADGDFRLEEVPAGRIRIVAVAPDRPAVRSAPIDVPPGGLATGLRIRLGPSDGGTRIAGIVLDPAGRAVPGARLVVRTGTSELWDRSGPDGRFEFPCEDFTPRDLIALDPERRRREAVRLGVRPGTAGLELRLAPAPPIEVHVAARDGQEIARFAVAVLAVERNLPLAFLTEEEHPGGLAQVGAPAQDFRIEVRAAGFQPARSEAFEGSRPPRRIDVRLEPAGELRGRITAAGAALAGARVTLHAAVRDDMTYNSFPLRLAPEPAAETESAADGRYRLSVPGAGTYHLLVLAPGFALAERGPLALAQEAEREEDVELDAGGRLAVRVHARDPLAAAGVLVAFSRGDGAAFTERTDDQGRIELDLLTPGPWQVELADEEIDPSHGVTRLGAREAEPVASTCVVRAGASTHLDLWLEAAREPTCRLSGRLVLDGEPAQGFLATLDRDGVAVVAEQAFDEPGLFRLGLDEPGDYRLRIATEDPGAALVLLESLELGPGERRWSLELVTGGLQGSLAGGGGPALLFHRWRRGALECLVPLTLAPDGRFRAERVPAGRGELVRFDPARALAQQTPEVLAEVEVVAGRTSRVEL